MLGQFCALDEVGSLGGFSELVVSRGDFVFSPPPPPAASTDELRVGVDCVLTCRLLLR